MYTEVNGRKRRKEWEFMLVGKNAKMERVIPERKMERVIPERYRSGQGRRSRCAGNSTGNRRDCGGRKVKTNQASPHCLHRAWPHTTLLSKGPSHPVLPG